MIESPVYLIPTASFWPLLKNRWARWTARFWVRFQGTVWPGEPVWFKFRFQGTVGPGEPVRSGSRFLGTDGPVEPVRGSLARFKRFFPTVSQFRGSGRFGTCRERFRFRDGFNRFCSGSVPSSDAHEAGYPESNRLKPRNRETAGKNRLNRIKEPLVGSPF